MLAERARSMIDMLAIEKGGGRYFQTTNLKSFSDFFKTQQTAQHDQTIYKLYCLCDIDSHGNVKEIVKDLEANRDIEIAIQKIVEINPKMSSNTKITEILEYHLKSLDNRDKFLHLLGTTNVLTGTTALQADELMTQIARYYKYPI